MSDKTPVFWGDPESENLDATDRDDAIEAILDEKEGPIADLPATITIAGFARMEVTDKELSRADSLECVLERLDEEYGNPEGDPTKPTDAMREAEREFLAVIKREYKPWACEEVCREVINVQEWIKEHRPDWLAE